jgi:predicted ester cyclase
MSTEEQHRALFDALVANDFERISRAYAAEFVFQGPDGTEGDFDAALDLARAYRAAFPDLAVTFDRQWTPGPDVSIIEYTAQGTHLGDLAELPPTGRKVTTVGCSIIETRAGLVVRERLYLDSLSIMTQLAATV